MRTAIQRIGHSRRRARVWFVIAPIALVLLAPYSPMVRGLSALDLFARPEFTNHPDQIKDALTRNNVAVARVYVEQGWPDQINQQTYGANLVIYASDTAGEKPVLGRVECREAKKRCWYQVAKLGIRREELVDLAPYQAARPASASLGERVSAQVFDVQTCAADVFGAGSLNDLKNRAKCLTSVLMFPRIVGP